MAPAGDARISIIDPRDIAAAAAVLLGDGHDGTSYVVTGPHAITYVDAAAQLAAGLDRPVSFVNVPDLTFRDASTPDWFADNLVAPYQQLRAGVAAEGPRKLRYEPARAALGLMSVGVPVTAVAAVVGVGLPAVVGQAGLVAAQIVVAGARAHETAQGLRRSAPGYLLRLREELNPVGVVDRARRTIRRASRSRATTRGLRRVGR